MLCGELIEHLMADPMHLMSEVNRVLKPGGHLVLTTPNVAGLRGISAILQGYHPGFFQAYVRPPEAGEAEARHNREYTPREIRMLLKIRGSKWRAGNRRIPGYAASGVRLGGTPAGTLPPGNGPARRRYLRGGTKDGAGEGTVPRVALRMSAAYLSPEVKLDAGKRTAHAEFEIQNDSQAVWRAAEGFGIGYHLFDAETGTLIVEARACIPRAT